MILRTFIILMDGLGNKKFVFNFNFLLSRVRENCDGFGGDRSRITLLGKSIHTLFKTPSSRFFDI